LISTDRSRMKNRSSSARTLCASFLHFLYGGPYYCMHACNLRALPHHELVFHRWTLWGYCMPPLYCRTSNNLLNYHDIFWLGEANDPCDGYFFYWTCIATFFYWTCIITCFCCNLICSKLLVAWPLCIVCKYMDFCCNYLWLL
jgi:hypothetical protein